MLSLQSGLVLGTRCHGDAKKKIDSLHPVVPSNMHTYLLTSCAGEVVNGTPDSPVDQDPGLEFLKQPSNVFVHLPALLPTKNQELQCHRGLCIDSPAAIIPGVCINNFPTSVNVDFPRNTRNLLLCVFGQQLKAQSTSANKHSPQDKHSLLTARANNQSSRRLKTKTTPSQRDQRNRSVKWKTGNNSTTEL